MVQIRSTPHATARRDLRAAWAHGQAPYSVTALCTECIHLGTALRDVLIASNNRIGSVLEHSPCKAAAHCFSNVDLLSSVPLRLLPPASLTLSLNAVLLPHVYANQCPQET